MTAANNRYSYSRVTVIRIDVHPVGEIWTTRHTHLTLTPRMVADHTYLTRSTHSNLLWGRQQICTDPLPSEKKGSRHNPQLNDCLIYGSVLSFSPTTANEVVGKRQAFIDNQLLGLPGPYHRHAIDTFNTCSRGPTHRSLIDIGGGYNLGGVGLPQTTPRPSQPAVSTFHLRAPPGLQFNHELLNQSFKFKAPMAATCSSNHSAIYRSLHLCLAIASDLSLVIGVAMIDRKVVVMQLGINQTLIT
jgi:hypothetical protein